IIEKVTPNADHPNSMFRRFVGNSLAFAHSRDWRRIRRMVSPAFHQASPAQIMGDTVRRMFAALVRDFPSLRVGTNGQACTVAMDAYLGRLTMDILGRTVYGYDFRSLENPDSKYAVLLASIVDQLCNPLYILFPWLDNLPGFRRRQLAAMIAELDGLLFGVIEGKRRDLAVSAPIVDPTRADLLTLMLQAYVAADRRISTGPSAPTSPPLLPLTGQELRDNAVVFYLAGQETTAGTLGFWMYTMAQHPEVQAKARTEVLSILGEGKYDPHDRIPTDEQLRNLVYVAASLHENLRLNPPFATMVARETVVPQIIAGQVSVPANVRVGVHIMALQRSPTSYGPDANVFRPERFLEGASRGCHYGAGVSAYSVKRLVNGSFFPFGGGARQCIAKNFSMLEQKMVASMLLRKYEWSLDYGPRGEDPVYSPPFALNRPQNLRLVMRALY
ncbi:hypothetical protein IWQ60_011929, partial [Tieghemiomyces parasiticus]